MADNAITAGKPEKPLSILHLEDEPADAELVQAALESDGISCEITWVKTRSEFEDTLRTNKFDLVLSDYRVPGYDGLAALRLVKAHYEETPFIFISGTVGEDAAIQSLTEGGTDYVLKHKLARLAPAIKRELKFAETRRKRKRAEEALEESEKKYRAIVEQSTDGIVITNEHGTVDIWNASMEAITGLQRCDTLGKPVWEVQLLLIPDANITPELLKPLRIGIKNILESKTVWPGESREQLIKCADGTRKVVQDSSFIIKIGESVRLGTILRDITERKRAEEALRKSERQLRLITENARDTIWLMDMNMKTTWISPSVVRTRGYTLAELADMPLERHLTPDSLGRMMELAAIYLTPEKLADPKAEIVVQGDFEFYRKDGTTFWGDTVIMLLRDANGMPEGFLGVGRDITDRKRAEAEREILEEQLRVAQKMEAIGSLAGGVAHDFNNLLSVILSYTSFAMEEAPEGSPLKDGLMEIEKAGERAAALTRQLLAFGRKQVLQPVPLDLNQIALGIEKMLHRILGEDIDFTQVLAPDLGVVFADPGQIEQVLMNLVVNARDAMPDGGKLMIETSNVEIDNEYAGRHVAVKPGPYVLLAVTDTGLGMDEQTRARIFEPFFTTKEKGKGTGLGLSTVHGIVNQSGGSIWVYSEVGKGTTFKIYLPRKPGAIAATAVKASAVARRLTGTETIIVVDDEESLRKVAKTALEAAGYTVLSAANGNEAVSLCAQHNGEIHLLLTDVVMPGMNGRILAQELLKTRQNLKILYMSGYTDNAIIRHGVLDAGTYLLSKPYTGYDLTRKVREVLESGISNISRAYDCAAQADAVMKDKPLDRDMLRGLPGDLLDKLRRAVATARFDELVALIEAVRVTNPEAATGLRRMADSYDYYGMRGLLGPWKGE